MVRLRQRQRRPLQPPPIFFRGIDVRPDASVHEDMLGRFEIITAVFLDEADVMKRHTPNDVAERAIAITCWRHAFEQCTEADP